MGAFTHSWAHTIIQHRWLVLALTFTLMLLAPLSFNRVYYDASNEAYFLENDPHLLAFDDLLERFGDSEYLVIGIPARKDDQDVFHPTTIKTIDALTQFLEEHEHVTQVRSLSKYQYTHNDTSMLATDDLFEDIDRLSETPEIFAEARRIMADETLALDTLLTRDFQHTRIAARVEYIKNENAHNVKLVSDLLTFIEEQQFKAQGFELYLSGVPVIGERFETLTINDQKVLNPAMALAMMLILFLIFRSVFATFVPLVVILATLFFLKSIQGILIFPNTAVSSALIPTMIILSMGASVHVLVEFFQARRRGLNPKLAAEETTSDLFYAILFTSLTTAVGFIALAVTELRPVREFAIMAAMGPMIIFLLATTTLPAVLSFIPWMPRNSKKHENARVTHWLATSLPTFTLRNKKRIAIIGTLISVFSLYSVQYIKVDTNVLNYFKDSSWTNQGLHYFNNHFQGVANLEVIIDTGEEGGVKNPELLQRTDALQDYLESIPETGKATSILDFYKQINQSLNDDNSAFFLLPDSRPKAAQFLLLYENTGPNEDLSDLKDFDERFLRISIPLLNLDETEQSRVLKQIQAKVDAQFSDLSVELTGSLVMNNAQNVYTNKGMFQSFGVAMLVIGLCFFVLFGSFKYGLIALIPSLIPVILTGGLISYAGISLDLGTMIVGAMTIGIAVDDSIHVMSRYRLMRRRGYTVQPSISYALSSSGRAVVLTSLILVVGFSVMVFGNFVPFIYVGLFSAMIMVFALIGDLIFMPALLQIADSADTNTENTPENTPLAQSNSLDEDSHIHKKGVIQNV